MQPATVPTLCNANRTGSPCASRNWRGMAAAYPRPVQGNAIVPFSPHKHRSNSHAVGIHPGSICPFCLATTLQISPGDHYKYVVFFSGFIVAQENALLQDIGENDPGPLWICRELGLLRNWILSSWVAQNSSQHHLR